jgi:hypothetical protein
MVGSVGSQEEMKRLMGKIQLEIYIIKQKTENRRRSMMNQEFQ